MEEFVADRHSLVIEVAGEVIGAVQFGEEEDPMYRHANIDVYVTAARHGQGFGSRRPGARPSSLEDRGHHRTRSTRGGQHGRDPRLREGRVPAGRGDACVRAGSARHVARRTADGAARRELLENRAAGITQVRVDLPDHLDAGPRATDGLLRGSPRRRDPVSVPVRGAAGLRDTGSDPTRSGSRRRRSASEDARQRGDVGLRGRLRPGLRAFPRRRRHRSSTSPRISRGESGSPDCWTPTGTR